MLYLGSIEGLRPWEELNRSKGRNQLFKTQAKLASIHIFKTWKKNNRIKLQKVDVNF